MASNLAHAAGFAVIGRISGSAQIGAHRGSLLYGTSAGGGNGAGTLFSVSRTGQYTLLHDFISQSDGAAPNARLAIDNSGDIFGTAFQGGVMGGGTLWEYSAAGVMTTPHAFGSATDGRGPKQGPTLSRDGTLYGTTYEGEPNDNGVLFGMASNPGGVPGSYAVVYNFLSGTDGHCPFSGVATRGTNGEVYGTTVGYGYGGNPNGSVFRYTGAGLHTMYSFTNGADGGWPDQAPVLDASGDLYGTTHLQAGVAFPGAIWTIDAAGTFKVLHAMNAATDGSGPNSPLLVDTDGDLYGTTASGGAGGHGTLFQITPGGTLTVLHAFDAGTDGAAPSGNLIHDSNGVIYGGTSDGVVFAYTP